MRGEFPYKDNGLLDRTHLRFFTIASIAEMLRHAGFLAIEIRRVVLPVFSTELKLDRSTFEPAVVEAALRHDEAETYQFVVKAVPDTGDHEISRLAARAIEADDELNRERTKRLIAESQLAKLEKSLKETRANAETVRIELAEARQDRGRAVREASVARLERAQARGDAMAARKELATTGRELSAARKELATVSKGVDDAERRVAAAEAEAARQLAAARAEGDRWRREATTNARRVEMVMGSKTMRYTSPLRVVYRRIRQLGR
jgi:chromosome segregation ATPase